jgi:hypothetical protein
MNKQSSFYPNRLLWAVWIAIGLCLSHCKRSEPDPCLKFKADFDIVQAIGPATPSNRDSLWVVDTVLANNYVGFRAKGDYESYEWQVGKDPFIRTTKQFALFFEQAEGKIDVRLIARKKRDLLCDPQDDGIDTIRKSVVVLPREAFLMVGEYEGVVEDAPNNKFTISIKKDPFADLDNESLYQISNINQGCIIDVSSPLGRMSTQAGYRAFFFTSRGSYVGQCESPGGFASLGRDNKTITVDFWITPLLPLDGPSFRKKFVGKRK